MKNTKIKSIDSLEILDSRGNPTVLVCVELEDGSCGSASVPSGASTGTKEALELRDGNKSRYSGKGVLTVINNIKNSIQPLLIGEDAIDQLRIDSLMITHDATQNKSKYGANAILGVSMAVMHAAAKAKQVPLYQHVHDIHSGDVSFLLPVPLVNILNGGVHGSGKIDFQEFMIVPIGFDEFNEALRASSEIFHTLGAMLDAKGLATSVGFEGGYAPAGLNNKTALEMVLHSIEKAKYRPAEEILIALDLASTEFYDHENFKYKLKGDNEILSPEEMVEKIVELVQNYPIFSVEDGLSEEDWKGWQILTEKIGSKVQLVGDDIFVTSKNQLEKGVEMKVANSILIKVNQVGTISETLETVKFAKQSNYSTIISHRSGETEDTTISDLAVGWGAGQIKTGSTCRGERTAKYNRLLRISHEAENKIPYAGRSILPK